MGYSVQLGDDLFAYSENTFGGTDLTQNVEEPPGYGIQLRLSQLREVKAVEPWPSLHVAWATRHVEMARTLAPTERRFGASGPSEAQLTHEEMVVTVMARLKMNPNAAGIDLELGWTAFSVEKWTDVDALPDDESVERGAFRTPANHDPVVARREAPTALESMLIWLASSPDQRLADTPREVVLTGQHVYANFSGGAVRSIPRETLRARRGPVDDDAVYVFGRRTRLVLPHRQDCPVRTALDLQLERPS